MELFANPARLQTALLLAPAVPGDTVTAAELAGALGLTEGAVLRELVVLAAMGMLGAAPQRAGNWTVLAHPLWRVIAGADETIDEQPGPTTRSNRGSSPEPA